MDYDATEIPVVYDSGRDHGPEVLNLWMNVVASYVKRERIETIVDLGCGTGRFSEVLASHFDASVIGLDPSKKMLEQARTKLRDARVRYELGSAESIPLTDNSIDLVFISMVFHHFENPGLAARECHRVLRPEGRLFLRAGTREKIPSYPYVDFFPESRPILEECLCGGSTICQVFEAAGFRLLAVDTVTQEIAPNYEVYAEKLAAGADSVLARLNPSDFEAGIKALRLHATGLGTAEVVVEPIDVFVFGTSDML